MKPSIRASLLAVCWNVRVPVTRMTRIRTRPRIRLDLSVSSSENWMKHKPELTHSKIANGFIISLIRFMYHGVLVFSFNLLSPCCWFLMFASIVDRPFEGSTASLS